MQENITVTVVPDGYEIAVPNRTSWMPVRINITKEQLQELLAEINRVLGNG